MWSAPAMLKPFPHEALLELALVLCLGLRVVSVCPPMCSCSRSHRDVDCSQTGLRELPDGLQHNIRFLNLSHNRLVQLDGRLKGYTHLRVLDLSHNKLSRLPADLPRSLWELYATSNHIHVLDKNDTAYQWNLQRLDLSQNKLERAIFINNTMINLCKLNLSHNHFWTLPTNLPAYLETIDLSHNLLVKVLPGSLDRLPRLTHLYLHANRFSSLPAGVLDNVEALRIITLGNNPWACHLYDQVDYLLSWTQQTPARVLGCPCHTRPVCGGARHSRTGAWHHGTPRLAAGDVNADLTATWYHPFTEAPISFSISTSDTHGVVHHLARSPSTDQTPAPVSLQSTDSPYFSDKGPITDPSGGGGGALATDRFFITEASSIQTKRTATPRTRSVRRHNQTPSGAISLLPLCSLLYFFLFVLQVF